MSEQVPEWLEKWLERIERKLNDQAKEIVAIREQLAEAKGAVKGGKAAVGIISGIAASVVTLLAAWIKGGTQ